MEFEIKRETLVKHIFSPIGKITDSCELVFSGNKIHATAYHRPSNTVLCVECESLCENVGTICIGDVNRLVNIINSGNDDEATIRLKVIDNYLLYETSSLKFKYHLKDSSFCDKTPLSKARMDSLEFDVNFDFSIEDLTSILQANSFVPTTNKFYFYMKDKKIHVDITDYETPNMDYYTLVFDRGVSTQFEKPFGINMSSVRHLAGSQMKNYKGYMRLNTKIGYFCYNIIGKDFNIKTMSARVSK